MKRNLTTLSALYETAQDQAVEAWKEIQPFTRGPKQAPRLMRVYIHHLKRCEILKEMIKAAVDPKKEEDDFDEPLPTRACNLDDENCESCS